MQNDGEQRGDLFQEAVLIIYSVRWEDVTGNSPFMRLPLIDVKLFHTKNKRTN